VRTLSQSIERISALRFFQTTALCFGLAIIGLTPPFQVPDEPDHFERAFHLSEGIFFGIQQDQRLGGEIPASITALEAIYHPIKHNYTAKHTSEQFEKASAIALKPKQKVFEDFPNTGLYPITVYLPQTLAITVGRLFKSKPLYILYFTRLCTLLFWIFLITKAIRILPHWKWEFAFLALLPGALFINASASGDVVTNGVAFLVLAFCIRTLSQAQLKVSYKQMIWLAVGIAILALNKFVYAPVLLLAFLFPKAAFPKPKYRNQFAIGLLVMAIGIVTLWNLKTSTLFIPKSEYNPLVEGAITLNDGVDPKAQFDFMLNNPFEFAKIAVVSAVEITPASLAHYFGKFGWEKNYLPTWTIVVLLLTTLLAFFRRTPFELPKKTRLTFLVVAAIMFMGLAATLYMMWSPVGNDRILSLGGRYLIPVLPLVWLAMPRVITFKYHRQLIVSVSVLALLVGLFSAYARYY